MDTTMELDELKQAWHTLDKRLQQQNALQFDAFRERKASSIKASLRPLFWGQLVQMLFGIATVVAGVWLWKNFSAITTVLVAGIIVHLYGIATIIASGAVLGGLSKIDRSLPVLELQQRLATLRRAYIVSGAVVGLPWWLLWMVPPVVVMSLHAQQTGVAAFSPSFLGWSAVGVAGLLGTLWFHRWSRKPGREALAKRLDDGAAGGSLRKAQAEMDALKAYENE
ncbi:MAG: hypothetical protein ABL934_09490 [Lysobacteraceae bacterium]